jgi:hypothetical protein
MSSVVCGKKAKISATDTHRQYADDKDFLPGRPAQAKVSYAFQA